VLIEWTDANIANTTFEGTAREILRVQLNTRIHPLGDMAFNPAARPGDPDWRVMYVACGDGGAGEHEVQVVVDRDRAAKLGLSPQVVAQTVAVAMRGDPLKEFRADDREIQMRLAFRADNRQTLEDLAATPLYLPDGRITASMT